MDKIKAIWTDSKSKIFSFGDQAIVSGVNFLVAILISKFGGLETYGEYAIVWIGFFLLHALMISFAGLPFLVLGNKAKSLDDYCRKNLQLVNITLLSVWFLSILGVFVLHKIYIDIVILSNFLLLPTTIILFVKHEQHRRYFFAKGKSKNAILIDVIAYLLQVPIFFIVGLRGTLSLEIIFYILLILGATSNVVFHLISSERKLFDKFSSLPVKQNWKYAKFLLATNLIQWTSSNFLLLSLGAILGVSAIGTVRLVQSLMGILHVFFITIENVVPAKASNLLHQHSTQHFKIYFKAVVLKSSLFFGGVLIILWMLKGEILGFIYGLEFIENKDLFGWFIFLYAFIFIGTLIQIYLKTTEGNKIIFLAYVMSLIASFLTSNYLIETFNIVGYVYGLILFQIIGITIYLISIKRMNYGK